ncbi:hypothetical protein H257_15015 [Aphanomyces astaci]|uniref:GAG-pre-integrase domain-containing protein n=1 Tax=Aphanomyces astaci TaxID=112090 RepID=W4FQG1_APHAT|nr:hypothetical protein H257_15015 [Aphanomyces astaci]ETV69186.1 hypothetical protein H257_15015 [Aphanomyces astaci]|eukprot:XP_009841288.1 hypothetical protein H257_15015 [Aphanomyces astaci]
METPIIALAVTMTTVETNIKNVHESRSLSYINVVPARALHFTDHVHVLLHDDIVLVLHPDIVFPPLLDALPVDIVHAPLPCNTSLDLDITLQHHPVHPTHSLALLLLLLLDPPILQPMLHPMLQPRIHLAPNPNTIKHHPQVPFHLLIPSDHAQPYQPPLNELLPYRTSLSPLPHFRIHRNPTTTAKEPPSHAFKPPILRSVKTSTFTSNKSVHFNLQDHIHFKMKTQAPTTSGSSLYLFLVYSISFNLQHPVKIILDQSSPSSSSAAFTIASDSRPSNESLYRLWHNRFGHPSDSVFQSHFKDHLDFTSS